MNCGSHKKRTDTLDTCPLVIFWSNELQEDQRGVFNPSTCERIQVTHMIPREDRRVNMLMHSRKMFSQESSHPKC